MTRVLVSVPNGDAWIHKEVSFVLLNLLKDPRYQVTIIEPTHIPFENNLHHIVNDFVKGDEKGPFDYWLSMDADNPPRCNPLDLIEWDFDIVGLPTPVWHWTGEKPGERPIYWNAYDYDPVGKAYREHLPQEGVQKVDAIGTGCFIIARRVFDVPAMRRGAFTRKLHPDGRVNKGNDISFCERARKAGFEIACHYDYPCMHFVELELTEVIRAYQGVEQHG